MKFRAGCFVCFGDELTDDEKAALEAADAAGYAAAQKWASELQKVAD